MKMKIKIDKPRDLYLIEKYNDKGILKGSRILCGCCGEPVGIANKNLEFPFPYETFAKGLKKRSIQKSIAGVRHETCGHTMFSFSKSIAFMPLDTYLINVNQTPEK